MVVVPKKYISVLATIFQYPYKITLNHYHSEYSLGNKNINMNLHFPSYLVTDMAQVVEIIPRERHWHIYLT